VQRALAETRPDRAAEALASVLLTCAEAEPRHRARTALVSVLERWATAATAEGNLERGVYLRRALTGLDPGPARRTALLEALITTERLGEARRELEGVLASATPAERAALAAPAQRLASAERRDQAARGATPGPDEAKGRRELHAGRAASAEPRLRAAVRAAPQPRSLLALGEALDQLGRPAEALAAWATALGRLEDRATDRIRPRPALPHAKQVTDVVFHPDGTRYYTACRGGTIKIWSARTGEVLRTIRAHQGAVTALAIDPQGRSLASGGEDDHVNVWELPSGRRRLSLASHTHAVTALTFDPQGRRLASGSDDTTVKLWAVSSGQLVRTLRGHSDSVARLVFEPQGRYLASMSAHQFARVWALPSGDPLPEFQGLDRHVLAFDALGRYLVNAELPSGGSVRTLPGRKELGVLPRWTHALALDPLGRSLATSPAGPDEKNVRLVALPSARTLRILHRLGDDEDSPELAFDRKGELLVAWNDTVRIWSMPSFKPLPSLRLGDGEHVAAFDPDTRHLVIKGNNEGLGPRVPGRYPVRLMELPSGKVRLSLGAPVSSVALAPDGRFLAMGSGRAVKLWSLEAGRPVQTLELGATVRSVAFDASGRHLAAGGDGKLVKVWAIPSGQLLRSLDAGAKVDAVAFDPLGRSLVAGTEGKVIQRFALPGGQRLAPLAGHAEPVTAVAFEPRGRHLASASADHTVRLWDLPSGRPLATLRAHQGPVTSVAYDPRGRYRASGGWDERVNLWELPAGRRPPPLEEHRGDVLSVTIDPGGRLLATASTDETVRLWDLPSGRPLATLSGHRAAVQAVAFDPRGRFLVTGSADETVRLWALPSGRLLATLLATDAGDWVVLTPDGYLDGSPRGRAFRRYGLGASGHSWRLGWPRYGVPGLLGRLVAGDDGFRLAALGRLLPR
jgi:WD40 repeat protein